MMEDGDHQSNPFEGFQESASNGGTHSVMTEDEEGGGMKSAVTANQHSLPNVEEAKVSSPNRAGMGWGKWTIWIILFLAVNALVIGLSLALTADKRAERKENNASTSAGGSSVTTTGNREKEKERMRDYLVKNEVSTDASFVDTQSAQSKAINWLANSDELLLDTPRGGLNTDNGYDFITRYVMAVFYYSMDGASWNFPLLFLSKHKTCDWFQLLPNDVGQSGVLCSGLTNQIQGVDLVSNNLRGTLPDEISALTTLTYFSIIASEVDGPIPSSFSRLTNLRTFSVPFCRLSGTIPEWIGQWKKMEFMYLSNNAFTGNIPTALSSLSNLGVLALDDNQLSGNIDFAWEFPKLEYLYLEDNAFTGQLPSKLKDVMPLIVDFDVSSNDLVGSLPTDLFTLQSLQTFDVHENGIVGSIPTAVINDSKLEFLALHKNSLTTTIPAQIGELKSLKHLDLSSNQLTGVFPQSLDALDQLTYLFLGDNAYSSQVIPTWIYAYSNLRELSLKNARLRGPISSLVSRLGKLILLDLDSNTLTGSIPSTIGSMPSLQYLLLNRNSLNGPAPSELANLTELRMLLLNGNSVSGSVDNTLCNLGELTVAVADCSRVACSCCCCAESQSCDDYGAVANLNPVWESGYQRQFFSFGTGNTQNFNLGDDDTTFGSP